MKSAIENNIIKKEKMKKIVSNTDYIDWLENFSKDNDYFRLEWIRFYLNNTIRNSKENYENIMRLPVLYAAIEKYANRNYMYAKHHEWGVYYLIRYKNFIYEIGILLRMENSYYYKRIELTDENLEEYKGYIDFYDIINDKVQPKTGYIDERIQRIKEVINIALNDDIPADAVKKTLSDIILKL